jgi:hypothetical protein
MVASFRKCLLIIPFFFVLNSLCSSNNQDENNPTGQKIDCKEDNPNIVKNITITPEKMSQHL